MKSLSKFAKYSWFVLLLNIVVILWGGFVSASGSGDGCGESWPLCADAELREEAGVTGMETFIELFHRATSGLALIAVVIMLVWAMRLYTKGHLIRKAAVWSTIFVFIEAIIGAGIVLFRLVAHNDSLYRAFSQPIHLVNTFLLLGALVLTAWWASGNPLLASPLPKENKRLLQFAIFGILLLSGFGTIASLATTIFPSDSFIEGIQKDFSADVHYLIRLRIWHPIIATALGGFFLYLYKKLPKTRNNPIFESLFVALLVLFGVQYGLGALNAVMLAPVWLQLSHLLVSDLLWMSLVLVTAVYWAKSDQS